MVKKLYLDRDGIINKHLPYVGTFERFFWHEEIIDIAILFSKRNYKIIVVTNQSGIERGYYSLFDFYNLSQYVIDEFKKNNIDLEIRACPHLPERNCFYRKPNIGMVNDLRDENDVYIGDQKIDMITAKKANISNRWLISKNIQSEFATKTFYSHKDLFLFLKNGESFLV